MVEEVNKSGVPLPAGSPRFTRLVHVFTVHVYSNGRDSMTIPQKGGGEQTGLPLHNPGVSHGGLASTKISRQLQNRKDNRKELATTRLRDTE